MRHSALSVVAFALLLPALLSTSAAVAAIPTGPVEGAQFQSGTSSIRFSWKRQPHELFTQVELSKSPDPADSSWRDPYYRFQPEYEVTSYRLRLAFPSALLGGVWYWRLCTLTGSSPSRCRLSSEIRSVV